MDANVQMENNNNGSVDTDLKDKNVTTMELKPGKARAFYLMIPFVIAVPVAYWLVFRQFGFATQWQPYLLGALGWIIALFLRAPVALAAKKMPRKKAGTFVASFSGPMEEITRVVLLAVTSMAFSWSLSVGQGWAAIEVVYGLIQGFALVSLMQRTDEKAMMAKQILAENGTDLNQPQIWGVIERISASAYHIGATLIIAANPWLVILMIPVHSLLNLGTMALIKKSLALGEVFCFVVGAVVLYAGFVLWS